jgi:hypothetical protein
VAGVIQGSMLGPILFLLYILDINEYLSAGAYHPKYANDILSFSTFIDIIDDHTQQSIDGMANWSKENHMRLNTIKTQHMIISYQKAAIKPTTTHSNPQRHRPQACRKIRVPRRSYQQQHELRRTMGGNLIENQPSHLPSKETQTHDFHGKQARLRLQKLDPEPVHLRRTPASISINKSKKGNASTTMPFPERHRHIHRESSACAQHQAHGGFFERTMRQHRPKNPQRPEPSHHDQHPSQQIQQQHHHAAYQHHTIPKLGLAEEPPHHSR